MVAASTDVAARWKMWPRVIDDGLADIQNFIWLRNLAAASTPPAASRHGQKVFAFARKQLGAVRVHEIAIGLSRGMSSTDDAEFATEHFR